MTPKTERAAIQWSEQHADGPSIGWENAKVKCSECDGWTGLSCPHGCGVELISTQAEDDAEWRKRMDEEERERRERRAARRREREARA